MTALRIILAILVLGMGLLIIASNWHVFLRVQVRRTPGPSWVPLVGGALAALGLLLQPDERWRSFWWVPLVLDWGTLPGITHAVLWHLFRKSKSRDDDPS